MRLMIVLFICHLPMQDDARLGRVSGKPDASKQSPPAQLNHGGFRDLREFLSRKKRNRLEDDVEDDHVRPQQRSKPVAAAQKPASRR
jgi:hypothetical protein